jgi:hypothetical protein
MGGMGSGLGTPSTSTNNGSLGGGVTPSAPTAQNTPSSQSSFGVALENLRYLLQKRITTFDFLKRVHQGKTHWFNTILLRREELDAAFETAKTQKRCALVHHSH